MTLRVALPVLHMFIVLVALAAIVGPPSPVHADSVFQKSVHVRGDCPDFIQLFKDLNPVVVNISIERHILQNSSAEPPLCSDLVPDIWKTVSRQGIAFSRTVWQVASFATRLVTS
jgi:hypothetical protein